MNGGFQRISATNMEAIYLALVPSEDQKDLGVCGNSQEKAKKQHTSVAIPKMLSLSDPFQSG